MEAAVVETESNRTREIARVEAAIEYPLRRLIIKHGSNLSYTEMHAIIIRVIQELSHRPAAEILAVAKQLTDEHRDFPRQRRA